ncbi:hypothetical protein GGR50DRAFT_703318 [Xylaria sp. CBS 124048]|nr:hypothetical protein GGR50DRAFT_703318 [Xylaria sp. CBS 124048]
MAAIYEELRDILFNPRFSDLTIVCEDGICFKTHHKIISLYSTTLTSMITQATDDNGQTVSRIEVPDISSDTIYMVLQFLYGGNYSDYETIGGYHIPSYVAFMGPKEIAASLETLPGGLGLRSESMSDGVSTVDGDYDDDDDGEYCDVDMEEDEEEPQEEDPKGEKAKVESDSESPVDEVEEDTDRDDERIRTFQGHNLFDSLRVYCAATRFNIQALKLLARDRFYRTAEKVLMFSYEHDADNEAPWTIYDHQRRYRSRLAGAIFYDFPEVVDELYQTVPESDVVMRTIPAILIAAGYNIDEFRDWMRPLLEKYPDLALAVVECLRTPIS